MANQFDSITTELDKFIKEQKIYFVATAMDNGKVNLSPKGMDSFRILSPTKIMWLNLTGSGNETATHLLHNNRITIMFCSFDLKPLILRLYGTAKVYHPKDKEWDGFISIFPKNVGARQLIEVEIDLVQTSCGFAVPFMEYKGERNTLKQWADKKGEDGIKKYWEEKNEVSLDGIVTGINDKKR
jgi:pyridoxamine 5'-phosphate oxidase-like protein